MFKPHDTPANGAGGAAGTHNGHAGPVPGASYGSGPSPVQTAGNRAAKQRAGEKATSGDAFPPASGNTLAPPISS